MPTEWEASFWSIDKEAMRATLGAAGATCIYPERTMRRFTFFPPEGTPLKKSWVRIRDEGDKITMSIKQVGTTLEEQKELEICVSDFEVGAEFLRTLGCKEKAYQETKRELWSLGDVAITIDTWPFLEPLVEVEGSSEEAIRTVSEQLGFNWSEARFTSVAEAYIEKYGVPYERINTGTPRLVFEGPNPFLEAGI